MIKEKNQSKILNINNTEKAGNHSCFALKLKTNTKPIRIYNLICISLSPKTYTSMLEIYTRNI